MSAEKILIVDDEEGIRSQLRWAFAQYYTVLEASGYAEALKLAKDEKPDLATLDIALSDSVNDLSGLKLLQEFMLIDPYMKIIMVTGNEDRATALESARYGAWDYYQKPIDLDELRLILRRAGIMRRLELENLELSQKHDRHVFFNDIIGSSKKMLEVFRLIEAVAGNDYAILVTGESGTGKELVAQAIHGLSARKEGPFVAINCGAIPETLLESELFGHEKGAFTDAVATKKGKFEYAHQGTLFLDEIGDLSLSLQVKLLRFLQDHKIERIGGKELMELNVRVLAATNADLRRQIEGKTFREDLFYRLSVITIDLPPLRDRGDDVIFLANVFLNQFAEENRKAGLTFTPSAVAKMKEYTWPGNVRELENRIKRAVILAADRKIKPEDLGFGASAKMELRPLLEIREEAEKEHILKALMRNNWNISKAATELGTSRTTLYDLMEKYKISRG